MNKQQSGKISEKPMTSDNPRRAQASLEITVALACAFLLLLGAWKIFFWANQRLVLRQAKYESTRKSAGSVSPGLQVDESTLPKLNIFSEK